MSPQARPEPSRRGTPGAPARDKPSLEEVAQTFRLPATGEEGPEQEQERSTLDRLSRAPVNHSFPPAMGGNGPAI